MKRYIPVLMVVLFMPLCIQSDLKEEKLNYSVEGCGATRTAYGEEGYELADGVLTVHVMRNCCSDEILVEKSGSEYRIIEKENNGEICKCNCMSTVRIKDADEKFRVTFTDYSGQVREIKEIKWEGEFCGWSTYAECSSDTDCKVTGCSGQVCAGIKEEIVTTCEWRECFDAGRYSMFCGCVNNKCQWTQS